MKIEAVSGASAAARTAGKTAAAGTRSFSAELAAAVGKNGEKDLDAVFQRAAAAYGVPENLLKAVAKAESGFRADAVSRCGAQGVMQLMPSTAKSLGVSDPFDPEQNIMGGAKYLGSLLGRYGDEKLALAAYNAGSGNVDKYGGVPPFAETKKYVERVLSWAGQALDAPASAGFSGAPALSGGFGLPAAAPSAPAFTAEDYGRFLRLLAQQLLLRTPEEKDDAERDSILTEFS